MTVVWVAAQLGKPILTITQPAMMRLVAYSWLGNVRELPNVFQKMVVTGAGAVVDLGDVPDEVRADGAQETTGLGSRAGVGLGRLEKEAIRQTLAMTGGNCDQTAQLLGIGERALYRKLKEYRLNIDRLG